MKKLIKVNKGLTLVALVVSIIILLILAGVTIGAVIGKNGILENTAKSKIETEISKVISDAQIDILGEQSEGTDYRIVEKQVEQILLNYGSIEETEEQKLTEKILKTPEGYEIPIIKIWQGNEKEESDNNGNIDDIFDINGKDEADPTYDFDKIHIGDFVNYNLGNWTKEEIEEIKTGVKDSENTANGIYELPEEDFQFGGFATENSKSGNAVPRDSEYNYVKEKNDINNEEQDVSGWRVFDVNTETNEIVLISAGCSEDYFQPKTNDGGYIGEYILTGNVNSNWELASNGASIENYYTKRTWNEYVNSEQGGVSARALRKEDLDSWYKKYIKNVEGDVFEDEQFRLIYETKYENLIDNFSFYWLSSAESSDNLYYFTPDKRNLSKRNDRAFGVRILVTLNAENLKFNKATNSTKKVISRGNEYTYSVWDIES